MLKPLSFEKKTQSKDAFLGGGFERWVSKSGLQGFVWPVWGRGGRSGESAKSDPEELFLPSWLHEVMECRPIGLG